MAGYRGQLFVQGQRLHREAAHRRKEAPKTIKIVGGDGGVPMDFAFWLQLKEVAPYDTRMRLVLHIDLNMMMRMMIGSKIQGAIDQIAEALAKSFNAAPQV